MGRRLSALKHWWYATFESDYQYCLEYGHEPTGVILDGRQICGRCHKIVFADSDCDSNN